MSVIAKLERRVEKWSPAVLYITSSDARRLAVELSQMRSYQDQDVEDLETLVRSGTFRLFGRFLRMKNKSLAKEGILNTVSRLTGRSE